MRKYAAVYGQSNYDICLQLYGNLDNLIQLCKDNGVTDISVPVKEYLYSDNFVSDKNIIGFPYGTKPNKYASS